MTFDRRVRHLEVIYRRRAATQPAPPSGFDAKRLDSCQQHELDLLLSRVEYRPDAPTRFGKWDGLEELCTCALQRLRDLMATAHGLPPASAPWTGPCPDADCIATEIRDEVAPCRQALAQHEAWMEANQR